ncbi:MAG: M14 family metallopeptidase, partial [Planctomycetia bacterium]|nr:M14 family metallopeptidase [Planctomycetia bacterium]
MRQTSWFARRVSTCFGLIALAVGIALSACAPVHSAAPVATKITTPKAHFGFNLGDDYCLANYEQYAEYLAKLEKESDRLKVVNIGETAEKRPQLMAVVTSPANHKKLNQYREIASKLANAEGVSPDVAKKLASEGKAVVWIDGGLHASEVLCAQAMAETIYQLLSATDAETLRILGDVIILFVHANPDGMDLCSDWYMRDKDPKKRSLAGLPKLYQKYIGHDNNRDFYANTQAETRNMNRVMYREWFPQIIYNHHQTGPPGTVLFCPPFRDPFNYNIDPLVINGIDPLGAAMMQRFLVENKPGATTRSGARYSTWWNGGLRTTA